MKANAALNQTLAELIKELRAVSHNYPECAEIVQRWAKNNFDVCGIAAHMDIEEEERGGPGLKAHLVKATVIKSAVEIATKYGIGEEEQKMPWDRVNGRRDYVPGFQNVTGMPFKELRLSFVALKRRPTSWYIDENAETWMNKLTKKEEI